MISAQSISVCNFTRNAGQTGLCFQLNPSVGYFGFFLQKNGNGTVFWWLYYVFLQRNVIAPTDDQTYR
jgi:hypothetical protein